MFKLRFCAPAVLVASLFFSGGGFGQLATNGSRILGETSIGKESVRQRTGDIMANPAATAARKNIYLKREFEIPGRESRPLN